METETVKRSGRKPRTVEEMVAYAVSHRIRVQILIILNEGVYSVAEVAEIIGEPTNTVSNHVRELAAAGSIEVAYFKRRRNTRQYFYRATETPEYSKAEVEAMTTFERQVTIGLVIQSLFAEVMASLWAEKMNVDPDVCLVWDRLNLDQQGREEVAREQEESWERLCKIEQESVNRVARSGEETVSYVTSVLGFERARKAPKPSGR